MTIALPPHADLWLGKPAPRYTSYPPATQFRPAALEADGPHLEAFRASSEPISLYIHIPFCRELCLFCGCHSIITKRAERIGAYLVALMWEIDLVGQRLGRKLPVAHLHFGGGSPSTLTPEQLAGIMSHVRAHFDLLPDAELAMELDPRTTSPELIAALAQEGFNRASLGVQDFKPEVQQLIHRIQPFETVERVMTGLRAAGITALSLDLMYGLPGQSTQSVAETARLAASLKPERLSLFSYAHVPGMKPYQRALEEAGLPDDMERLSQEHAVRDVLTAEGYVSIGIDHFAKPTDALAVADREGRLSRNFQGYTDDPASLLLGLGASSISDAGTMYAQNDPSLENYQQRLAKGELPIKRVCPQSAEDHLRAGIIRDLMCSFKVDLEAHTKTPAQFAPEMARLAPYVDKGLVRLSGPYAFEVDQVFRMAVRSVASVFDAYLDPSVLSSRVA